MSMPDRNFLLQIFQKVDRDRSGSINAVELQQALSNGTWTPFNPETVRMMIGMFDRDGSSTIDFDEFASLWKYVNDWQNCFRSFDRDNSGSIDRYELKQALTSFGYRLNDEVYETILRGLAYKNANNSDQKYGMPIPSANTVKFDDFIYLCLRIQGKGTVAFDDFIQACVTLQTLTNAFRKFDYQQNGVITIKYEDFLTLVFGLRN